MQKNEVILYRSVNGRWRYYSISFYKTLFNDYILIKKYGNMQNKAPTGTIIEYYEKLSDVSRCLKSIIKMKFKRGYSYTRPMIRFYYKSRCGDKI